MYPHSADHPDLTDVGSPRTKKSSHEAGESDVPTTLKTKEARPKKLANMELSDFLIKHQIKRETELFAIAKERKKDGKVDLDNFLFSKSTKFINELIEKTWKMEVASEEVEREKKSRIDIIHDKINGNCSPGCDKQEQSSSVCLCGYSSRPVS